MGCPFKSNQRSCPAPDRESQRLPLATLAVQLQRLEVRGPDDFDRVFQAATKERAGALITLDDAFVFTQRTRIVKLAAKSRLPAIYFFQGVCGQMRGAYVLRGQPTADMYRRAATYVDKILKGRKAC